MRLLNVTRVLQQRLTRNLPVGGGGAETRGSTGTYPDVRGVRRTGRSR